MKTVEDFVEFIIDNDHHGVYRGWTAEQITFEVERALGDQSFSWIEDNKTGKILGTVTARKLIGEGSLKILHISGIITIEKGLLKVFYKTFREYFPGYILGGNFRGKLFAWDISKMNKIEKILERI